MDTEVVEELGEVRTEQSAGGGESVGEEERDENRKKGKE